MADFYIKYTPARRGLTGAEYLPQYLEESYPGMSFDSVLSDGVNHYGILAGTGDELSKTFPTITGKFSAVRLTEAEFIGNCYMNYNPVAIGGETPPTFEEMMTQHGITVADTLQPVKDAKINLFKEISKKKFLDDNDSIADLARAVVLLSLHYDDLSPSEKSSVDAVSSTLKAIYSKDNCINTYQKMVANLQSILSGYYTAKVTVDAAADEASAEAVTYL